MCSLSRQTNLLKYNQISRKKKSLFWRTSRHDRKWQASFDIREADLPRRMEPPDDPHRIRRVARRLVLRTGSADHALADVGKPKTGVTDDQSLGTLSGSRRKGSPFNPMPPTTSIT